MISFKEFLEILVKWTPVKVEVDKSIHIGKLDIGDKNFKVENGFITLGDKTQIKVQRDPSGQINLFKDGNQIKSIKGKTKEENIKLLDEQKNAFSRTDISDVQFEFLDIDERHETLIKHFQPMLKGYRKNWDFAALLIASRVIKLEEESVANKEKILQLQRHLNNSFENVGRMVYNLFRSDILEKEILPFLKGLIKGDGGKAKENFLVYWYNIIDVGYPTAYFMSYEDMFDKYRLFKELDWRFDRGSQYVDVFSRGRIRNKITIKSCLDYCNKNKNIQCEQGEPYELGYTVAVKIRMKPKK